MRVSPSALSACLFLLSTTNFATAFVAPSPSFARVSLSSTRINAAPAGRGEFDHILGEGMAKQGTNNGGVDQVRNSRRIFVTLPETSDAATLVSTAQLEAESITADTATEGDLDESAAGLEEMVEDPYGDAKYNDYMKDMLRREDQMKQEKSVGFSIPNPLKILEGKDATGVTLTVLIPGIAMYAGLKYAYRKGKARMDESVDTGLDDYAEEMLYHDGDFEEMKLCHSDHSKRLTLLGPSKSDQMLKRYLALFAKRKNVSPQAISSLSHVFSMYKLSEEKAAKVLVELCMDLNIDRMSSVGKLYFYGNRILKSPEARSKLQPIRKMMEGAYDDMEVSADEIVSRSQEAIGEAAYKFAVIDGGKKQKSLTIGWEVLGLDREAAERIFAEAADEGFVSFRESHYESQNQKYDAKGRKVNEDGTLLNPDDDAVGYEDEEEEDIVPTGNVFECGECGFTMFIAQGRESKFYGPGFKCPECGASKDKFVGRDADE